VDTGELKPAPDKVAPAGASGAAQAAAIARGTGVGAVLARHPLWLAAIAVLLLILVAVAFFVFGPLAAAAAGAAALAGFGALAREALRLLPSQRAAELLSPATQTRASMQKLPRRPDFAVHLGDTPAPALRGGMRDSAEAKNFKTALGDAFDLVQANLSRLRAPAPPPLNIRATAAASAQQLDPRVTIPAYVRAGVAMPARIVDNLRFDLDEPMAYPRIDDPMYVPLKDTGGGELLVPNLRLLRPDSVTLLETNQAFIEAYMVGLNDEFGRELLWREYPTDQRGSYFRQFWDVQAYRDTQGGDADAVRERLYDISKIHSWPSASRLGDHDNRQQPGSRPREEAVLAVRGQLLKRYPTTLVYAHAAAWQMSGGRPDKARERELVRLTAAEMENPPTTKVRTPLYSAKVDPDIYFFGFDLSAEDAMGDPDVDDKPGWFFVFEERPGEPRFGADVERGGPLSVWNDIAWSDVAPANAPFIVAGPGAPTLSLSPLSASEPEKIEQRAEDDSVGWSPSADAGAIAYMLFQAPSRVAYHARELLTGKPT
jgi:hypothetical protein